MGLDLSASFQTPVERIEAATPPDSGKAVEAWMLQR
jgi:hypothetical protein